MNRRTFLKASAATALIPTLPAERKGTTDAVAIMKARYPRPMTLEAFCRDVLKVELTPKEQDDVAQIDDSNKYGYRLFSLRAYEIGLAATCALWLAYTHPDNTVWIHGNLKQWMELGDDVYWLSGFAVRREVWRGWMKRVWRADVTRNGVWPTFKPGDHHIYI